jgi:hypothetical protein
MVLPFEVTISASDLYFILLVLLKAPGGARIYGAEETRKKILGYIPKCRRFDDLQTAVLASLAARRNEVRLVRNATLASRTPHCIIPKNETVKLSSLGGPWRLRVYHEMPCNDLRIDGLSRYCQSLFVLCDGARLSIERMSLEAKRTVSHTDPYLALILGGENPGVVTRSEGVTLNGYVDGEDAVVQRNCPVLADLLEANVMERRNSEIAAGASAVIG